MGQRTSKDLKTSIAKAEKLQNEVDTLKRIIHSQKLQNRIDNLERIIISHQPQPNSNNHYEHQQQTVTAVAVPVVAVVTEPVTAVATASSTVAAEFTNDNNDTLSTFSPSSNNIVLPSNNADILRINHNESSSFSYCHGRYGEI